MAYTSFLMVRRILLYVTLLLLCLGMSRNWIGFGLDPESREALEVYLEVAELVRGRGAFAVEEDVLLEASLEGMLNRLDPHSHYYSPEVYQELMEDQKGKFSGLGMLVTKPTPTSYLLIVTPMPDTPASRAGLEAGDLILEVDGESTDRLTTRQTVRLLKGPEGTEVTIKVGRGDRQPEELTLKRAPIPKHSVPYAFLLDDHIGYLKLNLFGQASDEEVEEHLDRLSEEGMEALILDLRDNPGGALSAAVSVSSLFLGKGDDIVSVRGRTRRGPLDYQAHRTGTYGSLPLVVLVNHGTASAAEILAGAFQDQNRAILIGERTWGKGLVQTVTPVDRGAVAITTARYFTPSGRMIQRDYSESYDAYYFEEEAEPEDAANVEEEGGIIPEVSAQAAEIPELALRLERRRAFLEFMAEEIKKAELAIDSLEMDPLFGAFLAHLEQTEEDYTPEELEESRSYIRHALEREARTMLAGQSEGYKAMVPLDRPLKKAVEVLSTKGSSGQKAA